MTLAELMERLDQLAWREQIDFEASERGAPSEDAAIDAELHRIAAATTVSLLDALERDGRYPAWVLRLSPHVLGDDPVARARRLALDRSSEVRHLATAILRGAQAEPRD
jgi:hypothetical protein